MKTRIVLLVILVSTVISCSTTFDRVYVNAHRQTVEAIVPEYIDYVLADITLTPAEKQLRINTAEDWRNLLKRIEVE